MKKIAILLLGLTFAFASEAKIDPDTGLKIDTGWELVAGNCMACHSLTLVINQKGDRQTWLDLIRWMQNTQGLWEFDKESENIILTYLAKNYPNDYKTRKRIPLKAPLKSN
ncbi:cytochrome C [Campylobacter sp.]|uniref:cytochrome C n=1 Tax=Campylobacter sp. TaxID=205 RepID=UPI0026F75157|nr:cytochrome C [Campylobacter sp.]